MENFNLSDSHILKKVRQSFDKSAPHYDAVALPQQLIGNRLLEKLLPIHKTPNQIADIGAGTGYISEKIYEYFPKAHYTLNDISPQMLNECRKKFTNENEHQFTFLEGPMEEVELPFQDLIISNLALQWSTDLYKTLAKFQARSHTFAFTTLLQGTFQEWTDLMPKKSFSFVKNYPDIENLSAYCLSISGPNEFFYWTEDFALSFEDAIGFLKHLKDLGAHVGTNALSENELLVSLRKAPKPFITHYKIFFGIFSQNL